MGGGISKATLQSALDAKAAEQAKLLEQLTTSVNTQGQQVCALQQQLSALSENLSGIEPAAVAVVEDRRPAYIQ